MSPGWVAASVVVVDTGRAPVSATLASVLAQTSAAEVILVTAASSVEERLGDLGEDAARCRVVHLPGAGVGRLLQAGLDEAQGLYVKYMLAGDLLDPPCLERQLEALSRYPQPAATACPARRTIAAPVAARVEHAEIAHDLLHEVVAGDAPPLATLLVGRAALVACGGIDPTYAVRPDHDLWLRLLPEVTVRAGRDPLVSSSDELELVGSAAAQIAEKGRALASAFVRLGSVGLVRASSHGGWGDPCAERIRLARALAASRTEEGRGIAHRLLGEARALGASRPEDDEHLRDLLRVWPEDTAAVLPPALRARAVGLTTDDTAVPRDADASPSIVPGRLRLAVWSPDAASTGAEALLRSAPALRAQAIDLLMLAQAGDAGGEATHASDVAVELVPAGDDEVLAAVLARWEVAALLVDAARGCAEIARGAGCLVLHEIPGAVRDGLATEPGRAASRLRRLVVAAARAERARATQDADAVRRTRVVEEARESAWRVATAGLRDPRSATGNVATAEGTVARRRGVAAIESRASRLGWVAAEMRARADAVLEKLRLTNRARDGIRSLRQRLGAGGAKAARPVPPGRVARFVASAVAARAEALWVVYATDPYSETRGQRSTWLAQELVRRGAAVVYFYWRWDAKEAIPATGDARVLAVPIDQFQAVRDELCEAGGPLLKRCLLAEFPDWMLFERMAVLAAHGFFTIYDCIDDWAEFAAAGQAHWYDGDVERHLARTADLVVATHPLLAAKLEAMSQRPVSVVPNGVRLDDLRLPARAHASADAPVIGYFGHLTASWFDWELVAASAQRHPGWRFEIIGYGEPADLALPANVRLPGPVEHAALAARTASWSVAIIPFRETALSRAVDPVKLYEYLALGMPVVAVGMPHLAGVPGVEACDRSRFDQAIERVLAAPFERERVAAFVAESTWQRRVDRLLALASDAQPSADVVKALVA